MMRSDSFLLRRPLQKIAGYVELSRPVNGLIAFISVLLGTLFTEHSPINFDTFITAIVTFLTLSAGNALNDFFDHEIDSVNKPMRPIPSGRVSRKKTLGFSILLSIISIFLATFVNREVMSIALVAQLGLFAYAIKLKGTPLIGNLTVGLLTALAFIVGGFAVGEFKGTLIPAAFAFLFTTSREIVKDIEDVKGDRKCGLKTLPILIGEKKSAYVASGFMILISFFSSVPYVLEIYRWNYMWMITLGVTLPMGYFVHEITEDMSRWNCARVQKWMKWDIVVGLTAIYFGI